jgi:endonuclease/exonuclease/phosphatase family metal-dependent hydrolase
MSRTLTGLLLTAAVLVAPVAARAEPANSARHVKVMTRNVYLGADIGRPIAGTAGCATQQACLYAFATSNDALWNVVVGTDFPARAKLLAAEILDAGPDLVGLQEVALWRHGPMQLDQISTANATEVDYDFLAILLEELGGEYALVRDQVEADLEGPAFAPDGSNARDIRLTMRDVILRRVDPRVRVRHVGSGQYATSLALSAGGVPVVVKRGYVWADVEVGKHEFRFVDTHLEAFASAIALAQAQELVAGPAAVDGPLVVVGDFNSDPLDGSSKPQDIPHWSAYRFLTGEAGFTDAWEALRTTSDPGWTSGLSETVDDADTSTIDHRIDLVLVRGARARAYRGWITGLEARTAGGLWASDHAGVVVTLKP